MVNRRTLFLWSAVFHWCANYENINHWHRTISQSICFSQFKIKYMVLNISRVLRSTWFQNWRAITELKKGGREKNIIHSFRQWIFPWSLFMCGVQMNNNSTDFLPFFHSRKTYFGTFFGTHCKRRKK